jgi:hypothetical protein
MWRIEMGYLRRTIMGDSGDRRPRFTKGTLVRIIHSRLYPDFDGYAGVVLGSVLYSKRKIVAVSHNHTTVLLYPLCKEMEYAS